MHETVFASGRDTFLLAVPFVAMLLIGLFRLDERFTVSRRKSQPRHAVSGLDVDGEPLLCDPDGRRWH